MTMAKALAMFDALDADDNGFIDETEMPLKVILEIEATDKNGSNDDARLSVDEFQVHWRASTIAARKALEL